jgi:hypothetical protein
MIILKQIVGNYFESIPVFSVSFEIIKKALFL